MAYLLFIDFCVQIISDSFHTESKVSIGNTKAGSFLSAQSGRDSGGGGHIGLESQIKLLILNRQIHLYSITVRRALQIHSGIIIIHFTYSDSSILTRRRGCGCLGGGGG